MKKTIFIIVFAALLTSSCNLINDKLDKYPLDTVSPGSYFKDRSQLQTYMNYCYANMFSGNCFDYANDIYFKKTLTKYQRGGTQRTVNNGLAWDFGTLRHINSLFTNIDNCKDEAVKKEYIALAKFFRTLFYYEKLRSFGEVPWIEKELWTNSPELYNARDSRDVVLEHMIKDIDDAIEGLPSDAGSVYRVNKWAAVQLKSRFLLFEGTWRKYHADDVYKQDWKNTPEYYLGLAAEAAKLFITESPYTIFNTGHPELDYRVLFATQTANSQEIVLAKNYSLLQNYSHFGSWNTCEDNGWSVNKKFVDAFLMKDGSRFTDKAGWETMEFFDEVKDRDPRLGQIIRLPGYLRFKVEVTENVDELAAKGLEAYSDSVRVPRIASSLTGFQVSKYDQGLAHCPDTWTATDGDLPIMRAAEVYLNYAEAKAEAGSLTQADLDLSVNVLRKRAGMPDLNMAAANSNPDNNYMGSSKYGFRNVKGANKGVILEIRRERMIELAQEGDFRWFDLMRWKEGKCMEQPYLGMYFPGAAEYDLNGDSTNDIFLYTSDTAPAASSATEELYKIGKDVFLSGNTSGYLNYIEAKKVSHVFDEGRDYLEPIPTEENAMNPKLGQNPGWEKSK